MNHVKSLIRLIDRGDVIQVMLHDGSMIRGFWPHDIIARGNTVVVVRGLAWTAAQSFEERVIPLCDIGGVFGDRPADAARPDASVSRRPVPRGWTTIHRLA